MNPRVKAVSAEKDYNLIITFTNNETRIFDMKPYLDKGVFKELKEPGLFQSVRPFMGSVVWVHNQDLCPDTLYEESRPV